MTTVAVFQLARVGAARIVRLREVPVTALCHPLSHQPVHISILQEDPEEITEAQHHPIQTLP